MLVHILQEADAKTRLDVQEIYGVCRGVERGGRVGGGRESLAPGSRSDSVEEGRKEGRLGRELLRHFPAKPRESRLPCRDGMPVHPCRAQH